ncbi:hypothetical protein Pan241w_11740 [Gimesia alba]|uniref:HTH cro/C1-type domain-containing protein n=1 Tax=Gimesia alba TaxID=2527973 RepID=A0A517RB52_9PLAN|nr:helix-turn-helix transcriptional regulator [Gimesia alba]QDT41115.1 hypothetical protein Pan241w_11740 [Gimesia alba]
MVSDTEAKAIVSANLTRLLDEQGHSRYWLSKQTGDDQSKISRIISLESIPSAGFLMRAADALDVSLDEIMKENAIA